jgi:hypothetical protein
MGEMNKFRFEWHWGEEQAPPFLSSSLHRSLKFKQLAPGFLPRLQDPGNGRDGDSERQAARPTYAEDFPAIMTGGSLFTQS